MQLERQLERAELAQQSHALDSKDLQNPSKIEPEVFEEQR
jgi:hypothetical protein